MSVYVGIIFQGIATIIAGLLIIYGCHRLRTCDRYITFTTSRICPRSYSDRQRQRSDWWLRFALALGMGMGALYVFFGVATLVTLTKA